MVETIWLTLAVILIVALAAALFALYYFDRERDNSDDGRDLFAEYYEPDFSDKANFLFDSLPDNDALSPLRYWLVNETIAEIEYLVVPGHLAYLRTAESGQLAVPTQYNEENYDTANTYAIGEITVTHQQTTGRKNLLTWTNEEFDYALYGDFPEMNMFGGIATDFVTSAHAKKTDAN